MATENPADPATWVWTAADKLLVSLIAEVHRRGMRIIIDGVFNHMGITSWPFEDVRRRQQDSPYKDWFVIRSWDNPQTGERFSYDGWAMVPELPEWREDERGIVPGPRDYIFAATRRWMDPNGDGDPGDGIDGWRLDVAFCVSHAFWRAWRQHVRAVNPEAYIVGELFGTDEVLASYLQGDTFDAAMNYPFAYACYEYFIHEQHRIDTSTFDRKLAELRAAYPACVAEVQQNLLGSHDTNRIGSHIVNRAGANIRQWEAYCQWSSVEKNPSYDTRKPTVDERRLQKLAVLFQMTYLGAPMVYYGDEAGMWGANDPCCRKPMVWPDLSFAPEARRPDGTLAEAPDPVAFDQTLYDLYRGLIHLRNNTPALSRGDFTAVLVDDAAEVYAFQRSSEHQRVLVVINRIAQPQQVVLPAGETARFVDLLNGGEELAVLDGALTVEVPPLWGRILLAG
jgi:glycosidase